jgi:transcriptional regulator with PAS, ATPase and Fis domain
VNCGALVSTLLEADLFGIEDGIATGVRGRPGKFEAARGGTIFLDEVAELSRAGQVSLLRVLQERVVERVGSHRPVSVDVRIVAATHQDLDALVARRRFRFDLLQRLRVLELVLPPLRTRGPDILHLAQTFLSREAPGRSWSFAPAVQAALLHYGWPGNVRELAGAMQSVAALATSSVVTLDDLPRRLTTGTCARPTAVGRRYPTLWEIVTAAAQDAFDRHDGNKRRACAELEINYRTFERLREAVPGRIPFVRLRRAA